MSSTNTDTINTINIQPRWLDMVKTIDFKEAAKNLKKLLEEVRKGANQYVVKDNGQEMAVLLSYDEFQNLTKSKQQAKKRFFEIVDKIRERNKDVPSEQIEKEVAQAVAEVRQMKYGKSKVDS